MVFFDSNILIYIVENNEDFGVVATLALADALEKSSANFSILALTELLSHKLTTAQHRKLVVLERSVRFVEVSEEIAKKAGVLRATHPKLRTPDAIHLATALVHKASSFITNDASLVKTSKSITKIAHIL